MKNAQNAENFCILGVLLQASGLNPASNAEIIQFFVGDEAERREIMGVQYVSEKYGNRKKETVTIIFAPCVKYRSEFEGDNHSE